MSEEERKFYGSLITECKYWEFDSETNKGKLYDKNGNEIPTYEKLQQENAQLKKEYQTELDENCKLSELWKNSQVENRHLKSVLKEIREYSEATLEGQFALEPEYAPDFFIVDILEKINEIIDKGVSDKQ